MSALDLTKPYRTREGGVAEAITGPDGNLYGWMMRLGGVGGTIDCDWWTAAGRWKVHQPDLEHKWDLVNVQRTDAERRRAERDATIALIDEGVI